MIVLRYLDIIKNKGLLYFFRQSFIFIINKLISTGKDINKLNLKSFSIIKMEQILGVENFSSFVIKTNNYCNLHCEHCTNNCDIPLNINNENIYRRTKYEINISDLILFCERFQGVGELAYHHLTGGEVTMMKPEKVEEIINILDRYHRRITMQTVGYNIEGIDKKCIKKIYLINLDDHGINHDRIIETKEYLEKFYKGHISIINAPYHYDLNIAMRHPMNKGKKCHQLMRDLSLIDSIIYPCCNAPWIMLKNNNTKMRDELFSAGWTINNPDIIGTLNNWRDTIPGYFNDQCDNNCWYPHMDVGQGVTQITLKKNDMIRKPNSSYKK